MGVIYFSNSHPFLISIKKGVIIYDITLTNFANNTVQNRSFGRYFNVHR